MKQTAHDHARPAACRDRRVELDVLVAGGDNPQAQLIARSCSVIPLVMKVAVSVPDRVFEQAELVAKRLRVSRSRVYSQALEEFVRKHGGQNVREALEAVYGHQSSPVDPLLSDLQARALREKW